MCFCLIGKSLIRQLRKTNREIYLAHGWVSHFDHIKGLKEDI